MVRMVISRASLAQFKRDLKNYAKETGKTNREVAIGLAKVTAKSLATKTQPFGLTAKTGDKFKKSISWQVFRALAESPEKITDPKRIHNAARRRGVVPKRKLRVNHKWTDQELAIAFDYGKRQVAKAGMIKGAWIAAGESLGGKKIKGVPKWVRAHVKDGTSSVTGSIAKASVLLHNNISYLSKRLCDENAAFIDSIRRYNTMFEVSHAGRTLKKNKTI